MFTQCTLAALAATIFFTQLTNALPQAVPALPYPNSDLYTWSATDASCQTTAAKSDCTSAISQICSPNKHLTQSYQVTVGSCTAIFWVDPNNSVPSVNTCNAAFTQITNAGLGGALGYAGAARTADPLYVVYPQSSGTGNCFKKTGDSSPVVAAEMLPNGNSLFQFGNCGAQKRALNDLESRQASQNEGQNCQVDSSWGQTCSASCLALIAAPTSTNPFATTAGLSCFGNGCEATAFKVSNNCMNNQGVTVPAIFGGSGQQQAASAPATGTINTKRTSANANPSFVANGVSANVCVAIEDQLKFACSATYNAIAAYHSCATAGGTDGVQPKINFS